MCVSEIPTPKNSSAPTAFDNENYFDRTDGEKNNKYRWMVAGGCTFVV